MASFPGLVATFARLFSLLGYRPHSIAAMPDIIIGKIEF
jgi:hypothetical protein